MTIHLAASVFNLKNDLPYIQKIIDIIDSQGNTLALNWFDSARNNKTPRSKLDWTRITKNHLDAIAKSDLIIMEGTTYSFHHGFQLHFALTNKKPILFLFRTHGGRYSAFEGLFISGITNELLTTELYSSESDLESIVNLFVDSHSSPKQELNVELNEDDIQRLNSIARQTNRSVAAVIHDFLGKERK